MAKVFRILVIAGSDSSGGAGLEGDQKVIAAHGLYAMTATTALTTQNTQGVSAIHHIPSDFVVKQIDACISDIGVDIVKIGMLASAETVDAVAAALQRHGSPIIVLDPVMVSTSGAQLLPNDAIMNLRTRMMPITTILTPNIPEARLLLQNAGTKVPDITDVGDIVNIAKGLQSLGPRYVLVKGGHLPFTQDGRVSTQEADHFMVINVLYYDDTATIYETDYLPSKNTHGTGCALASAISCNMALVNSQTLGTPKPEYIQNAVGKITIADIDKILDDETTDVSEGDKITSVTSSAIQYIETGIRTSVPLGKGNGPINHFHKVIYHEYDKESTLRCSKYGSGPHGP